MNRHSRENRAILRLTFVDSLPVLMGYSTMGFVAGVLLAARGDVLLSALNHSYWILGVTVGAIVVCLLGMAVDPEAIRRWTNGMEFSMAALFVVILTDQVRKVRVKR